MLYFAINYSPYLLYSLLCCKVKQCMYFDIKTHARVTLATYRDRVNRARQLDGRRKSTRRDKQAAVQRKKKHRTDPKKATHERLIEAARRRFVRVCRFRKEASRVRKCFVPKTWLRHSELPPAAFGAKSCCAVVTLERCLGHVEFGELTGRFVGRRCSAVGRVLLELRSDKWSKFNGEVIWADSSTVYVPSEGDHLSPLAVAQLEILEEEKEADNEEMERRRRLVGIKKASIWVNETSATMIAMKQEQALNATKKRSKKSK